jgi:hypothetical protein
VKIKQYCSVCREELPMEVVPTEDGEDDGVIWLRCPRCQGFLPKIGAALQEEMAGRGEEDGDADAASDAAAEADEGEDGDAATGEPAAEAAPGAGPGIAAEAESPAEEGIPEAYAAMLAAMDVAEAVPYRPWNSYEVGDVIHHLAWDDCGVVVAKESLPGQRRIAKVYFEKNGIVRLIESAPGS